MTDPTTETPMHKIQRLGQEMEAAMSDPTTAAYRRWAADAKPRTTTAETPTMHHRLADRASLAHEEGDVHDPWPQVVDAILREMRTLSEGARQHQYCGPVISWERTIDFILNETKELS